MKTITKHALIVVISAITLPAIAQHSQAPTRHDWRTDIYLFGGYQRLNHPNHSYDVATFQMELMYDGYIGSRIGVTVGENYLSFSPCGILLFTPLAFGSSVQELGEIDNFAALLFLLAGASAIQFRIPLSDYLELSAGWDALRITKFKDYNDTFYAAGSLNVGFIGFLSESFFISGYYEYHHTHNTGIRLLNWTSNILYGGNLVGGSQPDILKGHSFGARIGWMF